MPLERATALSPHLYTDPDIYRLEEEIIFRRSWNAIGRVDQLARPGDYFRFDLAGTPLIAVRGQDDVVRVLSGSCLHRMPIAEGAGNRTSFQCPYHLCTYGLDGQLIDTVRQAGQAVSPRKGRLAVQQLGAGADRRRLLAWQPRLRPRQPSLTIPFVTQDDQYEPSPIEFVAKQVADYEASGGAENNTLMDKPVVILTTRGRHSGKVRKTPLMRVERDGTYAVVASMGGAPRHPVWYHNVIASPDVTLQDGPNVYEMRAREVHGEEKKRWWAVAVEAWPAYDDYQARTEREIPVFLLEPKT